MCCLAFFTCVIAFRSYLSSSFHFSEANSHQLQIPPSLGPVLTDLLLCGQCGHPWEDRYYAAAIALKDHRQILNTLSYFHANPNVVGVSTDLYAPYPDYGHCGGLECDDIRWR